MMGDLSALIYPMAFILSAGMKFDQNDDDIRKHVTNLSINKKFTDHPGQVVCCLPEEYPKVGRHAILKEIIIITICCTSYLIF